MNKPLILLVSAAAFILSVGLAWANAEPNDDGKADSLKIIVTSLEIDEKALNITYEIRNNTEEDAWILTGSYPSYSPSRMCGVAYLAVDGRLTFGSRINARSFSSLPEISYGRFTRLCSGQSQTESIYVKMPVNSDTRSGSVNGQDESYQYATQLAIEYSYYSGNLPEMIFKMAEEREKNRPEDSFDYNLAYFFSLQNEILSSRDDELLIRCGGLDPRIAREKVLRTVVDNIRIPYKEMSKYEVEYELPKLASCTKIEITYHPSMLEYFFPLAFQKNLLSLEELGYLQSQKSLVLEETQKIKSFTYYVRKAQTEYSVYGTLGARYRSYIDVICHCDSKPQISFLIYNDDIMIDDGLFPCREGFPSLKRLTPRIQAIDLRVRCAANLKNQWYRFRTYHFYEAQHRKDVSIRKLMLYPVPIQWCDDIGTTYPAKDHWWKELHICPSADEGKNHYAMNPNCEPNSPGDMVLLFETKAGWNQCGGQELFTFDNHDPKGGCVLLNNGTVKFIRTEQELNALKWK